MVPAHGQWSGAGPTLPAADSRWRQWATNLDEVGGCRAVVGQNVRMMPGSADVGKADQALVRSTQALVDGYAASAGRSVAVRIRMGDVEVDAGVASDEQMPAASLLKIPLALAAEQAIAAGDLDPTRRVPVSQVRRERQPGALDVLVSDPVLSVADVLGLALALSDNACADWLFEQVGLRAVSQVLDELGCSGTTANVQHEPGLGPLGGVTTAADAIRLMAAVGDGHRHPLTTQALRHTVFASRIPLGATRADVRLAHKTGSLTGVAHDAAILTCDRGSMLIAFLSQQQHDTLVTGYDMGLCTRALLELWGLGVRHTTGLM